MPESSATRYGQDPDTQTTIIQAAWPIPADPDTGPRLSAAADTRPVLDVRRLRHPFEPGRFALTDVLVLNAAEAVLCRRLRTSPRAGKCLIAIECKYYTAHLPLGQARGFAGLSADLGNAAHPIFVANIGSESVTKYLNGRKVPRELNVMSGAPEIEGVQSLIREAFKSHVGRRDSGLRI